MAIGIFLLPRIPGYFDDDGNKLNPNHISKPDLCTTCSKDEEEHEEILCNLNRLDQADDDGFMCYAYESKFEEPKDRDEDKDEGISF